MTKKNAGGGCPPEEQVISLGYIRNKCTRRHYQLICPSLGSFCGAGNGVRRKDPRRRFRVSSAKYTGRDQVANSAFMVQPTTFTPGALDRVILHVGACQPKSPPLPLHRSKHLGHPVRQRSHMHHVNTAYHMQKQLKRRTTPATSCWYTRYIAPEPLFVSSPK